MTRLFLVRHGQTDWNVAGRLQGTSDIALNAHGLRQAARAAASLAGAVGPQRVVVTSPLQRARATAEVVAATLECELHEDGRLTERAYGEWEGLVEAQRKAGYPEAHAVWLGRGEPSIAGYERHALVAERMRHAIADWVDRDLGDVVMVTHGSSGRMAILDLLSLPYAGRTIGNLENAAWSLVTRSVQGEWSLVVHNSAPAPTPVPALARSAPRS